MAGNAGRAGTSRVDISLVDPGSSWDGVSRQSGRMASELSADADGALGGCGPRHVRRYCCPTGVAPLLPLLSRLSTPFVTTLHNRLDLPGMGALMAAFPRAPFVAIS